MRWRSTAFRRTERTGRHPPNGNKVTTAVAELVESEAKPRAVPEPVTSAIGVGGGASLAKRLATGGSECTPIRCKLESRD